jgi:leader peptidase (prepilin peptidase) / N-methyltransferase
MSDAVLAVIAAVIGGIVGSFLNACIYRLPRGISLNEPRRSFCPLCLRAIPWRENVPVLSWFLLRGRCSSCGAKISFRYLLVELLTAFLFVLVWGRFGFPLAAVYWIFVALLLTATFIDLEHFLIPDELTIGGIAMGLLLSALFPQMMQTTSHAQSFWLSLGAAAFGFALLWAIVELGKLAFGNKRHRFEKEEPFAVRPSEGAMTLQIGEEVFCWDDIFARESDELVLECASANIAGDRPVLRFRHDRMIVADQETPIDKLEAITGTLRGVIIPREAMGFGDVKLIATIGAFLGWKAVLFALATASIVGCVAAFAGIFLARDKTGARVPFGPFLAFGALFWIFGGERIWNAYFGILTEGSAF